MIRTGGEPTQRCAHQLGRRAISIDSLRSVGAKNVGINGHTRSRLDDLHNKYGRNSVELSGEREHHPLPFLTSMDFLIQQR